MSYSIKAKNIKKRVLNIKFNVAYGRKCQLKNEQYNLTIA